jgi:methylase of polypeptide subunit release factors
MTEQDTMDQLVNDLAKQARAVRAADKRLQDQRAALDDLILQAMEAEPPLTWATLQQLTGLTQATLNASRRRALKRREDRPAGDPPAPRS